MATVYDIPDDVLHIILKLIVTATDWEGSRLDVTRVCEHWHAVAEGCPYFWSNLNLYHPDIVPIFASRCRTGPLRAFLRADEDGRKIEHETRGSCVGIIPFHSQRLTVVDIQIPYRDMDDLLHIFRNNPFPALKDLRLVIDKDSCVTDEKSPGLDFEHITYYRPPLELSLNYCPRLETLDLGHIFIRRLPHATIVQDFSWVNYYPHWSNHKLTMKEFLDTLQDCSLLRKLRLDCAAPQRDEPLPDGTMLKLANLRHIDLQLDGRMFSRVARHIDIPPDARFTCTIADSFYKYSGGFPPEMAIFGLQVSEPLTLELTIHNGRLGPVDLTLGVFQRSEIETTGQVNGAKGRQEPRFKLNWRYHLAVPSGYQYTPVIPIAAAVGHQVEALTGCSVEGIHVRCDLYFVDSMCWVEILDEYSDVKKIRIVHLGHIDTERISEFFRVLRSADPPHFRYPALESIELYGVGVTPNCVRTASGVLKSRQTEGLQLHELVVAHRRGEEANWDSFDRSTVSRFTTLVVEDM